MDQIQRKQRWREVCREFRESGMTRKAFCESHGVALSSLGYWLKRQSETDGKREPVEFVRLGTAELGRLAVLRIRVAGEIVAELDLPAEQAIIRDVLKAVNGLSIIASEQMASDPLCGALYVFCNRERRILKALWWDRNGFWLIQKRLERDRFPWPASEEAARQITAEELRMLLDGIDFWRAHRARDYKSVS